MMAKNICPLCKIASYWTKCQFELESKWMNQSEFFDSSLWKKKFQKITITTTITKDKTQNDIILHSGNGTVVDDDHHHHCFSIDFQQPQYRIHWNSYSYSSEFSFWPIFLIFIFFSLSVSLVVTIWLFSFYFHFIFCFFLKKKQLKKQQDQKDLLLLLLLMISVYKFQTMETIT